MEFEIKAWQSGKSRVDSKFKEQDICISRAQVIRENKGDKADKGRQVISQLHEGLKDAQPSGCGLNLPADIDPTA